LRPRNIG